MPRGRTTPSKAIYDEIRGLIDQGKLKPGDRIEAELQLVDRHAVGRDAVRRALQQLELHGLITTATRQGRHVREFAPNTWTLSRFETGQRRDVPQQGIDEWAADMQSQGCTPTETVAVYNAEAPVRVAECLNIEVADRVYLRRRFRYADGVLMSIADTWMPEWVAERPATSENGEVLRRENGEVLYPFKEERSISLPGGLIRAVGLTQEYVEDWHYSRHPSPTEADMLGTNEPVAEVARIGYDPDDQPFRAMITVSPGHRLAARYVLRVGGEPE